MDIKLSEHVPTMSLLLLRCPCSLLLLLKWIFSDDTGRCLLGEEFASQFRVGCRIISLSASCS